MKMKSFDELIAEIEKDSQIDKMNLEEEINRTVRLISKYLRWNFEYKRALVAGESQLAKLALERRDFYNGEADSDAYRKEPWNGIIKNQAHLGQLLDADPKICAYREKVDTTKLLVEMCDEMLGNLRYRNNHIGTILEVRKFESGA